jgi:CubicO group peptidase (beta-lactamase class C family)
MKKFLSILSLLYLLASCTEQSDFQHTVVKKQDTQSYYSVQKLDSIINSCYQNGEFNGTILVSRNKKVVYRKALGYANFDTKEKLIPESVFYLASVSKQFTAMAIMILSERNKLTYNDKLSKFFPEFPSYANNVTIKHLLTHTSGIPDHFRLNSYKPDLTNQDVLAILIKQKFLDYKPGDRFEYSNSGYILLAMITEKVSGIPFHEFMKANVFDPLGMTNTLVYDESKPLINNRAIGYSMDGTLYDYNILTTGAGGIFSTIDDLYLWDQALYTGTLVSWGTIYEAFTPFILNNGEISNYSFGWFIYEDERRKTVSHSGSFSGFRTHICRDLANKNAYMLLTNNGDAFEMNKVVNAIRVFLDPLTSK